jgi:hypothetical protein
MDNAFDIELKFSHLLNSDLDFQENHQKLTVTW